MPELEPEVAEERRLYLERYANSKFTLIASRTCCLLTSQGTRRSLETCLRQMMPSPRAQPPPLLL